jgi:NAD(P)-dependent dehydrogenase (short-subunit alcohol dehydrogenase family)
VTTDDALAALTASRLSYRSIHFTLHSNISLDASLCQTRSNSPPPISLSLASMSSASHPSSARVSQVLGHLSPAAVRFDFRGRVALVTGASSGIGAATALAFAEAGAHVILADVQKQLGEEQARQVQAVADKANKQAPDDKSAPGQAKVLFVRCDVSSTSDVSSLFALIDKQWGRLDFAFNNAGIEGEQAITGECSEANWDRVLAVNLKGVWLCMRHELALMIRPGAAGSPPTGGSIINNSSVAGLVGFQNIPAYASSKHGILGLTKTAALEYAKQGVRINAVCPGVIATPMIDRFTKQDPATVAQFTGMEPVGRVGQPKEVAAAVLFLCAQDAAFITGHPFVVDGAFVAQ